MTGRLETMANDARVRLAADVTLALLLAAAAVVDVARDSVAWGGRGPGQVLLALAVTLPLAWRARFPVAVVTVVNVASGLLVVVAAPHQPAFEPFVAVIVAFYSLGAHVSTRKAIVALALMFAIGIPFAVVGGTRGGSSGNLPPIVFLLGGWLIGRIIYGRRRRTLELEALTQELEAQRDLQARAAVTIERGRIARELHDVVAHNVSMMVVQAGAADRVLEGEQPNVCTALAAIATTGRETVDEMRTLLGLLRTNEDGVALSPQPGRLMAMGRWPKSCRGRSSYVIVTVPRLPCKRRTSSTQESCPPSWSDSASVTVATPLVVVNVVSRTFVSGT